MITNLIKGKIKRRWGTLSERISDFMVWLGGADKRS